MLSVAAVLIAIIGCSAAAASRASGPGLVVGTAGGQVQGKTAGVTDEYLGIPYAAPPVGALRWQPPQPAAPWHGIREATSFAPHCAQEPTPFGVGSTSENCLYLNVYTPAGAVNRDLPVMVYIHGGSLISGESDDYNPAPLVRDGVIVVTINYRLGALGFLADAALAGSPGGPSGDYGLEDQQAALRWVQRNVSGFGGNPRNVTLFGQSAGAISIMSQLVSPAARGLFQRVIVESGPYQLIQQSLATAESAGAGFAARAGCASNTAACLRSLPVSTILHNEDLTYFPNVDDTVLPQTVSSALASGQFSHVPVIMGTTHDEWRLFVGIDRVIGGPAVTAANYAQQISSTLNVPASEASVVAGEYPLSDYSSPSAALGAVGTDAIFACPTVTGQEELSKYVPVYAYEFNDENAPDRSLPSYGFPYGAAHTFELQYLFDLSNTPNQGPLSAPQQQLAQDMTRSWTSFAKAGVPAANWPPFALTDQRAMSLAPPRPQLETGYATEHHCSFWNGLS